MDVCQYKNVEQYNSIVHTVSLELFMKLGN